MDGIAIAPPLLTWAQHRSGKDDYEVREKFHDWDHWLTQGKRPTYRDIEHVARFTRVPLGYFFLPEPPLDELPIPDFRAGRENATRTSADLLDTIYLNQRRQAWYEEYLADIEGTEPLPFVGSAAASSVEEAARAISEALEYTLAARTALKTFDAARLHLVRQFEELGGLVVLNSMVGNNTTRMLSLEEFRGFTLQSRTAPLVFVNTNDTKSGQIFSLLHEYAHVWRGESGVSQGGEPFLAQDNSIERWCNLVAAEIAVPAADLHNEFHPQAPLTEELDRLSHRYTCSSLVVLIKLRDTGLISTSGFNELYDAEVSRLRDLSGKKGPNTGGDFYNNQPYRIGRTLSRAIVNDTQRGNTSMTEALRLMSFNKISMFDKYARRLGHGSRSGVSPRRKR